VPSRSLYEVTAADGPLSPAEAAKVGLAMLAALTAAHRAGVLHRDVKPGNVLMGADGRVVLTDFGLATFDGTDSAVTLPGLVLGSAQYVAPERARDGTSNPETDLWSLGATLYAAVEGRSPYARSSTMATLTALATALPDPPQRAGALKPVLNGLLRRNPKDRIRPAEAQRLLLRAADGTGRRRVPGQRRGREAVEFIPIEAPEPVDPDAPAGPARADTLREDGLPARRRAGRRALLAGAAAVALVLVAGLGVLLLRHQPHGGAPLTAPRPSASSSSAAAPPTPVLGTTACTSTQSPAPVLSSPPRPGWDALTPDFVWYLDPSGFRVSVPEGWMMTSGPDGVCFREPGDTRVLAVQPFTPDGDPVGHWRTQEAAMTAAGRPADYRDLDISPVPYYFSGAAQWEYSYLDATGMQQHGLSRCFIVSTRRAYTIAWRTRDFDWQPNLDLYRAIIGSFRPGP